MFNIDQIITALRSDSNLRNSVTTGAAGLGVGMLLSGGRLGDAVGNIVKVGAIAAIGSLAYKAWENHQRQQGGTPVSDPVHDAFVPPPHAGFEREELGKSLVRAMIAAAKADGRIDGDEKDRIFDTLKTMPLSAEEKAWVFDEINAPLDVDAVVARADTPAHAAEIYAASLVAITADTPAERTYLDDLARRLKLDPALVEQIHRTAEAPPEPSIQSGQRLPSSTSV